MANPKDKGDAEKGNATISIQAKGNTGVSDTMKRQIRYFDDSDEIPQIGSSTNNNAKLKRKGSAYSIHSLSSIRNGRHVVDPATALPVLYRTLSIDIERTQREKHAAIKRKYGDKTMEGRSLAFGWP